MKFIFPVLIFVLTLVSSAPVSNRSVYKGGDDSINVFRAMDKVRLIVDQWNNSINTKQTAKLSSIYNDTVQYYAKKNSPKECIASKENWLKANPGYKQELKHMIIYFQEDVAKVLTVEFDKIYTDKSTKTVTALLEFKLVNNEWKLSKETDMPSEVSLVKKIGPKTLAKKSYQFYREYWMDSRNTGLAHDMIPYKFSLELKVDAKISGTFSRYSGSLRSWTDYNINSGNIQNGILEISVSYNGSTPQKMHFKIIDQKNIMCIDKEDELYGKVLSI